jgi:hypothetical protein
MPEIMPATSYILPDEPCCCLYERNLMAPDFHSIRRYQIMHVIRDGKVAVYRTDMGLASHFKTAEISVIGNFIDETVGTLRDIADGLRDGRSAFADVPLPVSDLIGGYADTLEQQQKRAQGKVLYSIATG